MLSHKILALLMEAIFLGMMPCGAFAGGIPSENSDKPVIRVAYGKVIDDLPFYVGVEEGLFEKEGVHVELVRLIGAANNLAAVIRNDLQAGIMSSSQTFPAAQQALPIKIVSWLGRAHQGTHCGLHVRKDSDIHKIRDLRGKKIAMSNDNMTRGIISEALAKAGLAIKDVEVILGIGSDDPMQHEAVLKSGRVDVIIA
jgi:NitT/TauT family transport system substrate-binding protein